MNLVIEIGNTHIKIAKFEGKNLQNVWKANNATEASLNLSMHTFQSAILSGSGKVDMDWWETIGAKKKILFHRDLLSDIQINYSPPASLGSDRLINAWFASKLFPDRDSLVIDTGTCITFTLIDRSKNLKGGSISPGLALRAKSMHDHTENLPLIEINEAISLELMGNDTQSNLMNGAMLGALYEVDKRIEHYLHLYPNLNIIMTGGSTLFFENNLNYRIFADTHFTLKGLNEILLANE